MADSGSESQPPAAPAIAPGAATFVTNTVPDIPPNAQIIGLCTVSQASAGKNALGWHVADFLAYKALLHGETPTGSQTWLAHCDVVSLVEANPERYTHGKDRRLVNGNLSHQDLKIAQAALSLKQEFMKTLSAKSMLAKQTGAPLIIIVCGQTTLEQDIFFGYTTAHTRLTSDSMRHLIGAMVDVVMITPALFSAGWLTNPSFCKHPAKTVSAKRVEFLARQFGGFFASEIAKTFQQWDCPMLNIDMVDDGTKSEAFPGPAMPSSEQKTLKEKLNVTLHGNLVARLSPEHGDHSFTFRPDDDNWPILVGPRKHQELSYWREKWHSFPVAGGYRMEDLQLSLLGRAFGGNVRSQMEHIKFMVAESLTAWPDFWNSAYGGKVKAVFQAFVRQQNPAAIDCYEVFSILEHRATSAVVADQILDCLGLPKPNGQRCRDWNELKSNSQASEATRIEIIKVQREITGLVPYVYLPPGVNFDHFSMKQRVLEVPASYISNALYIGHTERAGRDKAIADTIALLKKVKARQISLLLHKSELSALCAAWLTSINMPVRQVEDALKTVDSASEEKIAEPAIVVNLASEDKKVAKPAVTVDLASEDNMIAELIATLHLMYQDKKVAQPAVATGPAVPASAFIEEKADERMGPLYKHRDGVPPYVVASLDRLSRDTIIRLITDRLELQMGFTKQLVTAKGEDRDTLYTTLTQISGQIAMLEAECRLHEFREDAADESEQLASVLHPSTRQPIGASQPATYQPTGNLTGDQPTGSLLPETYQPTGMHAGSPSGTLRRKVYQPTGSKPAGAVSPVPRQQSGVPPDTYQPTGKTTGIMPLGPRTNEQEKAQLDRQRELIRETDHVKYTRPTERHNGEQGRPQQKYKLENRGSLTGTGTGTRASTQAGGRQTTTQTTTQTSRPANGGQSRPVPQRVPILPAWAAWQERSRGYDSDDEGYTSRSPADSDHDQSW
ncbi:hypothetical protein GGR52DRAFT_482263 [Hypoxylon sp. FL1284]|nr:hypothetical protein GGR52DRAFT_482263 [Hypoxylon sp. FL1284]